MKKVGCYGSGFLTRIRRTSGDVVAYRWYENNREHKKILGPVSKYKSEAAAWKEIERLRIGRKVGLHTVNDLVDHWREREAKRRASSNWDNYQGYIRKWIIPVWGSRELQEVKAVDVEDWLGTVDLAPGSKKRIRDIMHLLYEHAIRHEHIDRNPNFESSSGWEAVDDTDKAGRESAASVAQGIAQA